MKIPSITSFRNILGATIATTALVVGVPTANAKINNTQNLDTFVLTHLGDNVPVKGTTDPQILNNAPSPVIFYKDKARNASIVVDLSENVLYKYDKAGVATAAYRIASGKKSTPTHTGLRIVSHVESFPYKDAPPTTERYKHPWNYGPKTLILNKLDPRTGKTSPTGEFIHGNNNPSSIGKYASLGCMRMDNTVIKKVAKQTKSGDLILIIE